MTPLPPGFFDRPFAHRALHGVGRPENSLAAIDAAVAAGYGIELDLQLTRDGDAVVFHDETLDRLTAETGRVAARSRRDLAQLVLRGPDGALCPDEPIPSLADVLARVAGRVPLLLEIKDQDGALGPEVGPLEHAVARALTDYGGAVAVMSFNPFSVAMMAELSSDTPRGLTTCAFTQEDWPDVPEPRRAAHRVMRLLGDVGACFISHDAADLRAAPVRSAKARGLAVACWTIRSPQQEATALEIADCVTFEGYLP